VGITKSTIYSYNLESTGEEEGEPEFVHMAVVTNLKRLICITLSKL